MLVWSIIYGLEQFSEWNGSELGWIAVGNISAGIEHLHSRERLSDALLIVTANVISMPPSSLTILQSQSHEKVTIPLQEESFFYLVSLVTSPPASALSPLPTVTPS